MTDLIKNVEKDTMVLYVMTWPEEFGTPPANPEAFVIPLMQREAGILMAVPDGYIPPPLLVTGNTDPEDTLVGPNKMLTAPGMEEDDFGIEQALDVTLNVQLADFGSGIVKYLREYDPVTDTPTQCFLAGSPQVLPLSSYLMEKAYDWIVEQSSGRLHYYSADENFVAPTPKAAGPKASPAPAKQAAPKKKVTTASLADQISSISQTLPAITQQLQVLQKQQKSFEQALQSSQDALLTPPHRSAFPIGGGQAMPKDSLAGFARAVGPAPRTKPSPTTSIPPPLPVRSPQEEPLGPISELDPEIFQNQDPDMTAAIFQQSQAMTALVAHLVNQDPLSDLASGSTHPSLSMRGASKRERLQQQLAERNGDFFLQVAQNAMRRTRPMDPLPSSLEDFPKKAIFSKYLERQGGFAQSRDYGLIMWMLAQIADAMVVKDMKGAQELLALTLVTVEQAAQDGCKWDLAYILSLQQDPPQTLFTSKTAVANPRLKAFAPLCPQPWATTALAYIKELDVITSRRNEAAKPQKPDKDPDADKPGPNPKRKRFPKKPKGDETTES